MVAMIIIIINIIYIISIIVSIITISEGHSCSSSLSNGLRRLTPVP